MFIYSILYYFVIIKGVTLFVQTMQGNNILIMCLKLVKGCLNQDI